MIAFHPIYVHELPDNHRFPMEKYDLLPRQLIHEGTIDQNQFFTPESIQNIHVDAVHCSDYLKRLRNLDITKKEQRTSGFIHNETLIKREWTIMEGTRMAAELAIEKNILAQSQVEFVPDVGFPVRREAAGLGRMRVGA